MMGILLDTIYLQTFTFLSRSKGEKGTHEPRTFKGGVYMQAVVGGLST